MEHSFFIENFDNEPKKNLTPPSPTTRQAGPLETRRRRRQSHQLTSPKSPMDLWGRRGGSAAAGGLISGEAGGLGGVRLSELASAPLKARKSTTQREKQQACARKRATSRHGARGSRSTREQPVEHIHRHLGDPACSLPHRAQIHACQAVAGRGESWLAALNGTQAQPKKYGSALHLHGDRSGCRCWNHRIQNTKARGWRPARSFDASVDRHRPLRTRCSTCGKLVERVYRVLAAPAQTGRPTASAQHRGAFFD